MNEKYNKIKAEVEKNLTNQNNFTNKMFLEMSKCIKTMLTSGDVDLKKNKSNRLIDLTKKLLDINQKLYFEFMLNYTVDLIKKHETDTNKQQDLYKKLIDDLVEKRKA